MEVYKRKMELLDSLDQGLGVTFGIPYINEMNCIFCFVVEED